MLIPVAVQLLPSDTPPGAKLWAHAEDGTGRAWFQWCNNSVRKGQIRLATGTAPPAVRHSLGLIYTNTLHATIDELVLAKYWTAAQPPEILTYESFS